MLNTEGFLKIIIFIRIPGLKKAKQQEVPWKHAHASGLRANVLHSVFPTIF